MGRIADIDKHIWITPEELVNWDTKKIHKLLQNGSVDSEHKSTLKVYTTLFYMIVENEKILDSIGEHNPDILDWIESHEVFAKK